MYYWAHTVDGHEGYAQATAQRAAGLPLRTADRRNFGQGVPAHCNWGWGGCMAWSAPSTRPTGEHGREPVASGERIASLSPETDLHSRESKEARSPSIWGRSSTQ